MDDAVTHRKRRPRGNAFKGAIQDHHKRPLSALSKFAVHFHNLSHQNARV
jgi:hypothetical protein